MFGLLLFLKTFIGKIKTWAKPKEESGKRSIAKNIVNYFADLALLFLSFLEMLPIFLVLVKVFLVAIIAGALLLVVLSVYFSIMAFFGVVDETVIPDSPASEAPAVVKDLGGKHGSKLSWSIEELNANLTNLTDFEQNLYKLSILINQGVGGYGTGSTFFHTPSKSIELDLAMFLGKLSIENGMKLYPDGKQYDIFTVPSMTGLNTSDYGLYGLSKNATLSAYDKSGTFIKALNAAYPAPAQRLDYPAQFFPWATFMSIGHIQTKVSAVNSGINSKGGNDWANTPTLINEIMDEWGFKSNREELHTLIYYFLLQAQYHGAELVEYPEYINFWCALHFLSSDDDSKRSLSNWSVKDITAEANGKVDYTESSFRTSFLGAGGMDAPMRSDHTGLTLGNTHIKFLVNGETLTVPVWKYVLSPDKMSTYPESRKKALNESWSLAQEFSRLQYSADPKGTGKGTRVLNFHYGLNSYLQGKEFVSLLESKVVPLRSSFNFGTHNPDGNATFTYDGKSLTTTSFVEQYADSLLEDRTQGKRIISNMSKYYGLSFYASGRGLSGDDVSEMTEEVEKQRTVYPLSSDPYGIPFHHQGGSSLEEYRYAVWDMYDSGNTLTRNGCMIYAVAYMLNAKTGLAVNPAEATSLMLMTKSLNGVGLVSGKLGTLFDLFGLKSKWIANSNASWSEIDSAVEKGAVVLLKFENQPIASSGSTHFIALNKKVVGDDGVTRYRMYSSSSIPDSLKLWRKQDLKGMIDYAVILY